MSGVRLHNIKPVVELFSAKVACKDLQWVAVGWIVLVKCSNAAQANYASADAGVLQNIQTGYISCRQGLSLQDIAAWLKQINLYANMQTCIATAKLALDANLNLTMLHCPKCKVMHIDIPNSVANIKH